MVQYYQQHMNKKERNIKQNIPSLKKEHILEPLSMYEKSLYHMTQYLIGILNHINKILLDLNVVRQTILPSLFPIFPQDILSLQNTNIPEKIAMEKGKNVPIYDEIRHKCVMDECKLTTNIAAREMSKIVLEMLSE